MYKNKQLHIHILGIVYIGKLKRLLIVGFTNL
jgi:hypothetical protein